MRIVLSVLFFITFSFSVPFDIDQKVKRLKLNYTDTVKSVNMLSEKRVNIEKAIIDYNKFIIKYDKQNTQKILTKTRYLKNELWKVMHDIGVVRYYLKSKFKKDAKIDSIGNIEIFEYLNKTFFIDYKKFSSFELNSKKNFIRDIKSLINYVDIFTYNMHAIVDDKGILHLYKIKRNMEWVSLNSPDYLKHFHEWLIPMYLFKGSILPGIRTDVKVYYNNQLNMLTVWNEEYDRDKVLNTKPSKDGLPTKDLKWNIYL